MASFGTIYPLSIDFGTLSIPFLPFLLKDLSIRGSTIANRSIFREMLQFAARHDIKPMLEKYPLTLEGISEARTKIAEGSVRYKAVLETENARLPN